MEFLSLIIRLIAKPFKTIWSFAREAKMEFSKVVWPTKKEAISMTIVVIIFSLVVAAYLGALDFGLTKLLEFILNKV